MRWIDKVRLRLRSLLGRSTVERELGDELRFHLEKQIEENRAKGMTAEAARAAALRQFGGVEQVKEECRDARGWRLLESFVLCVRSAHRRLRKSPGFAAVALITLATAIGANTAVFSVVEGVLLKPLPYPHPEQLVAVQQFEPGAGLTYPTNIGPSNYFVYRGQSRVFQDVGLYKPDSVSVTGMGAPEQVRALDLTQGLLPILAVPPKLGRWFDAKDDSPGAPNTTVLTYGFWQSRFGGDPGAIGKTIVLDGQGCEIIGVMPKRFRFLDMPELALFLPLQLDPGHAHLGGYHYYGIARLKPGVTITQADADLARLLPVVLRSFPPPPGYSLSMFQRLRLTPDIRPLRQRVVGNAGTLLWVLMGGIGVVLLIACANVAGLFLVRAEGRQQELAIRVALGATRAHLAAEWLIESLVLGLGGSVLGVALAYAGLGLMLRLAPASLPRLSEVSIDARVLLFALIVGVMVSLLFGSAPVLKYAQAAIGLRLREGGRSPAGSRRVRRVRNVLVTAQVALAFALLACSGLMIRSFVALTHVVPGFSGPKQLQTFRVDIPQPASSDSAASLQTAREISRKLSAIPGVSAVGYADTLPMAGSRLWQDPMWTRDRPYVQTKAPPPLRTYVFASPGYLHVMGTPLVAGRNFTWSETIGKRPVALVSESFARQQWGEPARAIGKQIRASLTDDWRQVIGVVGDVHYDGMDKPACSCIYFPLYAANLDGNPVVLRSDLAYVMRTPRAGSQTLLAEVRRAVWAVNASLPLTNVHTMDYFYEESMARTSFLLVVLGVAAGMALLLAIVGLYGVIAYSVSRRTREIGLRIALGAQQSDTLALVTRQGVGLVLAGLPLGIAAALGAARFMKALLFGVSPTDALTFAAVAVLLLLVASAACYVPARRAIRVDPVTALRHE